MLEEIKAVIFDLDGTLVDSMWMWKDIDIEFLGQYGILCPEDLQKDIEGMGFSETAAYFKQRFSLPESLEEIKSIWTKMSLHKYQNQVPLKAGVKEFLDYTASKKIPAAIATSNGRAMVEAVLAAQNIRQYFQVVTTACEVASGKPSPDIYLRVAELLKVSPQSCLVFEDVPAGILAGKRANMTVCAVEDEFSAHMREEKCLMADYYINNYFELLNGVNL